MNVLSMGMTGDYEVAIEEGATMVQGVGTGISWRKRLQQKQIEILNMSVFNKLLDAVKMSDAILNKMAFR